MRHVINTSDRQFVIVDDGRVVGARETVELPDGPKLQRALEEERLVELPPADPMPRRSATKTDWVTYATAHGLDAADADGLTRDQLADHFGA